VIVVAAAITCNLQGCAVRHEECIRCQSVLLGDDAEIVRKAVRKMLKGNPETSIVGEAVNIAENIEAYIRQETTSHPYGLRHVRRQERYTAALQVPVRFIRFASAGNVDLE